MLPGGWSRIFSNLPMSRVLRAGHERTAKLAHAGANAIATMSGQGGLPDLTPLANALDGAGDRIGALLARLDSEIEPQRRPLKLAVERSVLELRGPAFIESLYPELSRGSRAVAAEEDEDDDDTEGPETDGPVTA